MMQHDAELTAFIEKLLKREAEASTTAADVADFDATESTALTARAAA